jgi:hypothetical protein
VLTTNTYVTNDEGAKTCCSARYYRQTAGAHVYSRLLLFHFILRFASTIQFSMGCGVSKSDAVNASTPDVIPVVKRTEEQETNHLSSVRTQKTTGIFV